MGMTSKARARREREGFFEKYLKGAGIDIGAGDDPVTSTCLRWDITEGNDAHDFSSLEGRTFDWVYSSHCLEHLHSPWKALQEWWKLVKIGGYLIVTVPDEDLYEQGVWPSKANGGHITSWTIHKEKSWCKGSRNLFDYLMSLEGAELEKLETLEENLCDALVGRIVTYSPSGEVKWKGVIDQTLPPFNCECGIEGIVRKLL